MASPSETGIGYSATGSTDALSNWLTGRLESWRRARQPISNKMLDYYCDYMRIPRQGDTKGVGVAKSEKAKQMFVGSTRNKVRAGRARMKDSLFGQGDRMPFDVDAVIPDARPHADAVKKILTRQLIDGGFDKAVGLGCGVIGTYGTGHIMGPLVREKSLETVVASDGGGFSMGKYTYDEPYFRLARTLDTYPDPNAEDDRDGEGIFFVTYLHPEKVRAWADLEGYERENVESALAHARTTRDEQGSEQARQLRGIVDELGTDGRIPVVNYFGLVPLHVFGPETPGAEQPNPSGAAPEMREAIVTMAAGFVCRRRLVDYDMSQRPTHRCCYEEVEHELDGVGLAENNETHQKVINAAFRLYMTGKGLALLPPITADPSKFLKGEDFKLRENKVFKWKAGTTPEEQANAFKLHILPDVTQGWERVIDIAERFSDEDTGITKYTQGNDARHLNDTAAGISIIMGAQAVPAKEVMANVDRMWVRPCVEALLKWDLDHLRIDTVRRLHDDETADLWAQVVEFYLQYGTTPMLAIRATGASTFVAREVLMTKLTAFAALGLQNPVAGEYLDYRELWDQIWRAAEISGKSPVLSEADYTKRKQASVNPIEVMRAATMDVPKDSALYPVMMRRFMGQMGFEGDDVNLATALMLSKAGAEEAQAHAVVEKTEAQARKAEADAAAALADSHSNRIKAEKERTVATR